MFGKEGSDLEKSEYVHDESEDADERPADKLKRYNSSKASPSKEAYFPQKRGAGDFEMLHTPSDYENNSVLPQVILPQISYRMRAT